MQLSKVPRLAYLLALIGLTAVLFAAPVAAQPGSGLNCSFYERPGCYFSHVLDASPPEAPDTTYCCVFAGPNCCQPGSSACNGNQRVGPCWLSLPPDPFGPASANPSTSANSCAPRTAQLEADQQTEPSTADEPAPDQDRPATKTVAARETKR